jgi:DoxX-like family
MKTAKILFWITTTIIFLFEGVLPVLTFNSPMAKEGMAHLGYPMYFAHAFAVFKALGGLTLIIPQVPSRIKEWAYAGYGFDFIFAFISYCDVDGLKAEAILPLACLGLLIVSYVCYHKIIVGKKAVITL